MERIRDGRRNILIHGNATPEDVPVTEFPDDARIAGAESFVPANMSDPTLYPGDVVVGVNDGEIEFAELIYDSTDDYVVVDPLNEGVLTPMPAAQFSRRFYQADEIHIYDDVISEQADRTDVSFDESKIERPQQSRPR